MSESKDMTGPHCRYCNEVLDSVGPEQEPGAFGPEVFWCIYCGAVMQRFGGDDERRCWHRPIGSKEKTR